MTAGEEPDDTDRLEAEFGPQGWTIGDTWITVGSGPDQRTLLAWRDGRTVAALTADGLRRAIREAGG